MWAKAHSGARLRTWDQAKLSLNNRERYCQRRRSYQLNVSRRLFALLQTMSYESEPSASKSNIQIHRETCTSILHRNYTIPSLLARFCLAWVFWFDFVFVAVAHSNNFDCTQVRCSLFGRTVFGGNWRAERLNRNYTLVAPSNRQTMPIADSIVRWNNFPISDLFIYDLWGKPFAVNCQEW